MLGSFNKGNPPAMTPCGSANEEGSRNGRGECSAVVYWGCIFVEMAENAPQ